MSLLITRRWHLNSHSAFSTCATSTLKLARWFQCPAVVTDVIITPLNGLEHCEVSNAQNGRQRVHYQCCYVLYTFALFVKFTSSAQPEHRPSANAHATPEWVALREYPSNNDSAFYWAREPHCHSNSDTATNRVSLGRSFQTGRISNSSQELPFSIRIPTWTQKYRTKCIP